MREVEKARAGAYARFPIEGEVLEALDSGRLAVGEGTLFEPGCWLTLGPEARIEIGRGCFLNRGTMLAAIERIRIGDHVMFANGCFVGDSDHRHDDPDVPVTWQGFVARGPVTIGSNVWFGVNCVVTGGVSLCAWFGSLRHSEDLDLDASARFRSTACRPSCLAASR